MTDFKILNGDIAVDSRGNFVRLDGIDALFQRALIAMSLKKESFIYDRTLGSFAPCLNKNDEDYPKKLELVLNEALAQFENTYAEILEIGNSVIVRITIDDISRTEVLLNGSL